MVFLQLVGLFHTAAVFFVPFRNWTILFVANVRISQMMDYPWKLLQIIQDVKVSSGWSCAIVTYIFPPLAKPVIFNPPPAMIDFDVLDQVVLNCNASGYPKPSVLWLHNSTEVQASSRILLLSNGSLVLREAVKSDVGHYMCVASSGNDFVSIVVTLKLKIPGIFYFI